MAANNTEKDNKANHIVRMTVSYLYTAVSLRPGKEILIQDYDGSSVGKLFITVIFSYSTA